MAMTRTTTPLFLTLILFGPLGTDPLRAAPAKEEPKQLTGLEIAELLHTKRANFPGFDDPRTTLAEALEGLQKIYGVPFTINERAFAFDQVREVLKEEIAAPIPIPPMPRATLKAVLHKVLSRIPVPDGAVYLVRDESIELTTKQFLLAETTQRTPDPLVGPGLDPILLPPPRSALQPIYASFDKRTLEDALKFLADRSDLSVILDPRMAEKGKTLVSGTFKNVPLETTLRLLADMAELRAVQIDNAFYVTSPEKAKQLEQEQARLAPKPPAEARQPKPAKPNPNPFQGWKGGSGLPSRIKE